jgi:hypothetical protein
MRRIVISLASLLLVVTLAACKEKPQPAETGTGGNATDRSTNGTTGTGQPASPANDTASAATSLDTAAPSTSATTTSGTAAVPPVNGTSVVTPTDTSTTLQTSIGSHVETKTKKQ